MVFREIYEAMKLRKRFIIILTILSLGFIFQTLYFYSNPNSEKYETPAHTEVVKTPLKSTSNKTIINTRNLLQGIKLHREIVRNSDVSKDTMLPTTHIDFTYETTSPELSTSSKNINKSKLLGDRKFILWKRSASFTSEGFQNRSKSHLKSISRRYATRTNLSLSSGNSSIYSRSNLTKSIKFDHQKKENHPKIRGNGLVSRFEIDREVFAEDSNFRNVGFNEQIPLKKSSNQTEELINVENHFQRSESPSAFDSRITSVKDHRIPGVGRDQLSRDEILFGTLRPRNTSQLKDEVRIVSMSLYGAEARYMVGAMENAKLVKKNFPGWKLRFYVESPLTKSPKYGQVPLEILDSLRNLGADIHYIVPEEDFLPPMMWRFLIADDPSVDRFIIRDCDSRLTKRDFASVKAWMRSGQAFQCTRDHPSHAGQSVSGGLWGGESHKLRIILRSSWIEAMRGRSSNYFSDMDFLQGHIWPRVVSHAYCSDSTSCDRWPNSFPFPVPRYGYDHVGEVYDERGIGRKVDIRILQRQGENEACLTPHQD